MPRRRPLPILPAVALTLLASAGCETSPGPVVPPSNRAPEAAAPVAPGVKVTDKGRALKAGEAPPGGPPTRATP